MYTWIVFYTFDTYHDFIKTVYVVLYRASMWEGRMILHRYIQLGPWARLVGSIPSSSTFFRKPVGFQNLFLYPLLGSRVCEGLSTYQFGSYSKMGDWFYLCTCDYSDLISNVLSLSLFLSQKLPTLMDSYKLNSCFGAVWTPKPKSGLFS